jgi:hypothetical protein
MPETVLGCHGVLVDLALGQLSERLVRILLFIEALVQCPLVVAQVELAGKCRRGATRGDLVCPIFCAEAIIAASSRSLPFTIISIFSAS